MTATGSLYNHIPPARANLVLPSRILLNDVTLREGLEVSPRRFSSEDKLELARRLREIGMTQIQVGYPARSEVDRELTTRIKDEDWPIVIEAMCTAAGAGWEEEIEQTARAGADFLNIIFPTSALRLERLNVSTPEMLVRVEQAVRLGKATGVLVSFSPVDCTRTELPVLKDVLAAVAAAGADRFYIVDTAGVVYPLGMRYLATQLKQAATIPLAVHCHNDLGVALANSLVAVECGIEVVDVCVNGLGKRAGNVALDEMVVALSLLYDLDPGIRLDRLYDLSRAVAKQTGIPISDSKPLAGHNAFDFAVDRALRGEKAHVSWGALKPGAIGRHAPA